MDNTTINSAPFSTNIQPISNIYSSVWVLQNTSFTASNFNYAVKIYEDAIVSGNVPDNNPVLLSELFLPPRPVYGYGAFSPSDYLKPFLYSPDYYQGLVYATNQLENGPYASYLFSYGASWNPELQIAGIQKVATGMVFNIGYTFSQPHGLTAGDTIFVSAEDTIISGEQKVLAFGFGTSNVVVDIIWATPSVSTGFLTSAKRYTATSSIYSVFNGTNQYLSRTVNFDSYIAGNFNTLDDGNIQKFLSLYASGDYMENNTIIDFGDVISKKVNDWETIGFWCDPVELFDATGGELILNYEVFSTTASLVATFSFNVNNDYGYYRQRLEAPAGLNNLGSMGLINTGDEKYWDIYFTDSSDNSVISEVRRYVIDDECSAYEPVLVSWINRLGSLEYFTFTQNSRETLNISRNLWKKELGIADTYSSIDRGRGVLSQQVKQNITINSNWVTEEEYAWLNELVGSPYVWIFGKDTSGADIPVPVVIVDSSYEFKKKLTEQIFNMTLTLEYANDVWSVSQNK